MALQIPKSTTPTVQMAKANFVLPSLWKVGERVVALADVHCLDNLQIVVERDDGIDQGDEDHGVGPSAHRGGDIVALDTSHEDEEL